MIPTTTGAATAVGLVLPALKGKLDGVAIRVPGRQTCRVVDLVAELEWLATAEAINAAFRKAAMGPLKGILDVTDQQLVSVDFNGNSHSAIVDLPSTAVVEGNLVRVSGMVRQRVGLCLSGPRPRPVHHEGAVGRGVEDLAS